jgi:hypothetical protein
VLLGLKPTPKQPKQLGVFARTRPSTIYSDTVAPPSDYRRESTLTLNNFLHARPDRGYSPYEPDSRDPYDTDATRGDSLAQWDLSAIGTASR